MTRFALALSVLAVVGLSGCASGGDWTPMSGGRTAGHGQVEHMQSAPSTQADKTFNQSMHK